MDPEDAEAIWKSLEADSEEDSATSTARGNPVGDCSEEEEEEYALCSDDSEDVTDSSVFSDEESGREEEKDEEKKSSTNTGLGEEENNDKLLAIVSDHEEYDTGSDKGNGNILDHILSSHDQSEEEAEKTHKQEGELVLGEEQGEESGFEGENTEVAKDYPSHCLGAVESVPTIPEKGVRLNRTHTVDSMGQKLPIKFASDSRQYDVFYPICTKELWLAITHQSRKSKKNVRQQVVICDRVVRKAWAGKGPAVMCHSRWDWKGLCLER
jgi:hypothetical protein